MQALQCINCCQSTPSPVPLAKMQSTSVRQLPPVNPLPHPPAKRKALQCINCCQSPPPAPPPCRIQWRACRSGITGTSASGATSSCSPKKKSRPASASRLRVGPRPRAGMPPQGCTRSGSRPTSGGLVMLEKRRTVQLQPTARIWPTGVSLSELFQKH